MLALQAILGVFYCCCIVGAWTSTVTATALTSDQRIKVEKLRNKGKSSLSLRRYSEAIKFYSAALQLVEGLSGDECFELRRRCGLTLAECEIRQGSYERAVARCTEVIEEATNYFAEDESNSNSERVSTISKESGVESENIDLKKTLCRAHYRRGKSFKKLKLYKLACSDFKLALKYLPADEKCNKELAALEKQKDWEGVERKENDEDGDGELQDFAEDCQVSHPRLKLKSSQIKELLGSSSQQMVRKSVVSGGDAGGGLFDGLGASLGKELGGMGGLDLGGLGGLGGGLGGLGGGLGGLLSGAGGMQMILQLAGVQPQTAAQIAKVLALVSDIYKKVMLVVTELMKWKVLLLAAATAWWIFVLFRNGDVFKK